MIDKTGWSVSKYGYIDKFGKTVISYKFDSAGRFLNGLAPVVLGAINKYGANNYGVINKYGKLVVPYGKFDFISTNDNDSDVVANLSNGTKYNLYLDKSGNVKEILRNDSPIYPTIKKNNSACKGICISNESVCKSNCYGLTEDTSKVDNKYGCRRKCEEARNTCESYCK